MFVSTPKDSVTSSTFIRPCVLGDKGFNPDVVWSSVGRDILSYLVVTCGKAGLIFFFFNSTTFVLSSINENSDYHIVAKEFP